MFAKLKGKHRTVLVVVAWTGTIAGAATGVTTLALATAAALATNWPLLAFAGTLAAAPTPSWQPPPAPAAAARGFRPSAHRTSADRRPRATALGGTSPRRLRGEFEKAVRSVTMTG
ncbi:hypothetical protein ACFV5J_26420 [Streptomyces zaomyceticus]|uniref:hypothetical protein n=1 Tax=Streptomyces zaomyceticus TaxID=68286 RepID=UPI0036619686